MKKIEILSRTPTEIGRSFMLAKLGVTLLVLSMFVTYHSFVVALAESNIYGVVLYSALLAIQLLTWIWNVFL